MGLLWLGLGVAHCGNLLLEDSNLPRLFEKLALKTPDQHLCEQNRRLNIETST